MEIKFGYNVGGIKLKMWGLLVYKKIIQHNFF